MNVTCFKCGDDFDKREAEVNRTHRRGGKHFCSLSCSVSAQNSSRGAVTQALRENLRDTGIKFPVVESIVDAFSRGAARAAKDSKAWTLTAEQMVAMVRRSNGRCEVSGVEFRRSDQARFHRQPFAASIDRIDSAQGYTWENCRLVCVAVNAALNTWGDAVLREIVISMVLKGSLRAAISNKARKDRRNKEIL